MLISESGKPDKNSIMAKSKSRKRQRVEVKSTPLGLGNVALDDDATKDDEERELEALLFDKPLASKKTAKQPEETEPLNDGLGLLEDKDVGIVQFALKT